MTEVPEKRITKAPATLMLGPPGSGKTTSIVTYLAAGLEVFVLITDPGGEEALIDAAIQHNLPLEKLHWHYIPSGAVDWSVAKQVMQSINTQSYESLGKMKNGINKHSFTQMLDVMDALADFPCDRTGEKYGPVDSWGADRVIVIDSMTGINKMSKRLTVGGKPNLHQGEWGVAMEAEELFLDILISNTRCCVCCIAHIEKELDEVQGRTVLMASFLGKKLAPKIPGMFSDVVLAVKDGATFRWSTTFANVDLKARTLPLSDSITPSFVQVVEGWRKREAAITEKLKAPVEKGADTQPTQPPVNT